MQTLQAGASKFFWLELDESVVRQAVEEAGFQCTIEDKGRSLYLDLTAPDRDSPLLLFDASDPGNTGWFSRCQYYVDGRSGHILQTPFTLSNTPDPGGRPLPQAVRLQISKEVPSYFRLPGRQPVSEKVVYSVLHSFLGALQQGGVGLCGSSVVRALAGRVDPGVRRS
jgi:hypothetical protein